MNEYILCDDERSLGDAIDAIKLCSQVIFDCKGQDLGKEGGSLSLIGFRTTRPEIPKTYLIDVLSLTDDSIRPVFDIIQSPSPTKIVFDGRMDYAELFHGHSIQIQEHSVLDLQLVDVCSRRLRGEGEASQRRRLSPYLNLKEVDRHSRCYTQVQKLCSLEQCFREHEADMYVGIQRHSLVPRLLTRPLVSFWGNRPLPEDHLRYYVGGMYFIGLLFDHFKDKGYITDPLLAQSERYVTMWQDARPKRTDEYRSHSLLPLCILDYTSCRPVQLCICCQRNLPRDAYATEAWAKVERQCWICRAIYLKVKMQPRRS